MNKAFATHFHEFWPQAIRFYHRDKVINQDDWPRIVNLVKHSNTNVTIDLRMGYVLMAFLLRLEKYLLT
jgi:hypothetical protein